MESFDIIKSSPQYMSLRIKNVDLSIVNSIRRIILAEVPNVAFKFEPYDENNDIHIHTNTCSLHNEFLAHRISLLPLCFDENTIESFDPSKYRFVLKKKNEGTEVMNITTKDFEIYDENNVKYPDTLSAKVFPPNPITKDHILITKLKPNLYDLTKGEEIDIECFPSVNIAKTHARWSPVSKCTFYNTIDEVAVAAARKSVPANEMNKFECLDKFRYFVKNKWDEPASFDFEIESECSMTPKYLIKKAFDILKTKLIDFNEAIQTDNKDKVEIVKDKFVDNVFQFNIFNEDHTLLNVVQSQIYNTCFREMTPSNNPIEFIGYHQSHPLDKKMILKIKFKNDKDVNGVRDFMGTFIEKIITVIDNLTTKI